MTCAQIRRVVNYVEARHSRQAAAAHFSAPLSLVINLMTAFHQSGAVTPKALGGCPLGVSRELRELSSPRANKKRQNHLTILIHHGRLRLA